MQLGRVSPRVILELIVVLALVAPGIMWGQLQAAPAAYPGINASGNALTVEAALRTMSSQAAVVFVGTVTAVRRSGGDGFSAATGVVEVRFAVEQSIRGVADGGTYTLREWGGLWAAGDQRYKTGARLLMLLHAPGVTGLSSPVGGLDGVIPIIGSTPLVRSEDETVANDAPLADLRWLAAKLERPVQYRPNTPQPAFARNTGSSIEATVRATAAGKSMARTTQGAKTLAGETAALQDSSVPSAQASVATVLQMIQSWTKEGGDAR